MPRQCAHQRQAGCRRRRHHVHTITEQVTNFLAANKTFGARDIVLINGGISDLIAGMAQVNA